MERLVQQPQVKITATLIPDCDVDCEKRNCQHGFESLETIERKKRKKKNKEKRKKLKRKRKRKKEEKKGRKKKGGKKRKRGLKGVSPPRRAEILIF